MFEDQKTRETLLARLSRGSGERDWEDFYRQYASLIVSFCQSRGLDGFSARDVLQETMILVIRKIPAFRYDPKLKFRNWLLALADGKVRDAFKRIAAARLVPMDSSEAGSLVDRLADAGPDGSAAVEMIWRRAIAEEALRRLREDPKSKPESFEIFRACAIDEVPVAEVARRFGLQENAIYQLKNRWIKRLQEEVSRIENETAFPAKTP